MHSITVTTTHEAQRVLASLGDWLMRKVADGHRIRLEAGEERRNNEQNAKLHATLTEIARSKEWAGQRWDVEVWKRLLTAAWMRARGERVMLVPALDGQGVDVVFRRTSTLSKAECSELLEFVIAWAVENDVALSA